MYGPRPGLGGVGLGAGGVAGTGFAIGFGLMVGIAAVVLGLLVLRLALLQRPGRHRAC